jgi:hypothetical protein
MYAASCTLIVSPYSSFAASQRHPGHGPLRSLLTIEAPVRRDEEALIIREPLPPLVIPGPASRLPGVLEGHDVVDVEEPRRARDGLEAVGVDPVADLHLALVRGEHHLLGLRDEHFHAGALAVPIRVRPVLPIAPVEAENPE